MSASLSLRDAIHDFGAHVVAPPNNSPTTGRQLRDRCQGRIGPWVIHTPIKGDKIEACNCPEGQLRVRRAVLPAVAGLIVAAPNGAVEAVGLSTICSGLPVTRGPAHPVAMGSKSRETIYAASIRAAAERATQARKDAEDVPGIVQALQKRHEAADTDVNLAAEFIILTAVRTGEARFMRVCEVHFAERLWTIPAERMKTEDDPLKIVMRGADKEDHASA